MELMQLTQRIRPAYGFTDAADRHRSSSSCSPRISINANLGIRVIDTELDGFDTHSDQHDWHATLLGAARRRDRRVLRDAVAAVARAR